MVKIELLIARTVRWKVQFTLGWAPLRMGTSTISSSRCSTSVLWPISYIAHRNKTTVITSHIFSIFHMAHAFNERERENYGDFCHLLSTVLIRVKPRFPPQSVVGRPDPQLDRIGSTLYVPLLLRIEVLLVWFYIWGYLTFISRNWRSNCQFIPFKHELNKSNEHEPIENEPTKFVPDRERAGPSKWFIRLSVAKNWRWAWISKGEITSWFINKMWRNVLGIYWIVNVFLFCTNHSSTEKQRLINVMKNCFTKFFDLLKLD